jgi:ATP-binding cassette subfamily B protein/subfamily B ATP-binding cassette protein MsbA
MTASGSFLQFFRQRAKKAYIIIFLLMAVTFFLSICSIEILRRLVEFSISPKPDFQVITSYIVLYIFVAVFNFGFSVLLEYLSSITVKNDIRKSQANSYDKVLRRKNFSSLNYSAEETTVMLAQTLSSLLIKAHLIIRKTINSFITILFSVYYMQNINRAMILICFFPVIFIPAMQKFLFRHIGKIAEDKESISSKIYAFLKSVLDNIFVARTIDIYTNIEKKFADYTGTYKSVLYKENVYKSIEKNLNFFISLVGICLILAVGSFQLFNGKTTIPDIFAFMFAFEYFAGPIVFLTGLNIKISECKGLYERISVINNITGIDDAGTGDTRTGDTPHDTVQVETISAIQLIGLELNLNERKIKYPDSEYTFSGNGGCIVVKGENGSGKTSFFRMLMKFENNYKGRILINGNDLQQINTSNWRNSISYAPQTPVFHKNTVLENIIYFSGKDTDNQEIYALAGKLDFKRELLGRDVNADNNVLSEGEKQKANLIRAFLRKSKILILDEPFVSLDAGSRALLTNLITEEMLKRIIIIVSHDDIPAISGAYSMELVKSNISGD